MNCDGCGKEETVVHLTKMVDKEVRSLHFCHACAAERGLDPTTFAPSSPLSDFLAQMGGEGPAPAPAVKEVPEACGFCHLTFAHFREVGRLGCPHCYTSFESHLRGLLRRVHGGSQHMGKVYLTPDPTQGERLRRLEALRRKLVRAVEAEDFERAAELRDEIRTLEPVGG
ncbi:MAG: UvrB/UvrC motif-containing protein [Gemmatimonadota bacterium]